MKPGWFASSLKYWPAFLAVILVQLLLAWQVVVGVREAHISEIKQTAEKDIVFLQEIMREKLQGRNYLSADFFLQNWGESHCYRVKEIILEMSNGFILSHYESSIKPEQSYTLVRELVYSYRGKARLELSVNLDSVCVHVADCVKNMALLVSIFSLALALVLGLYLWQKKLARELRNSEARYREIFNAPNDAIIFHDAETGAILDVNRAMLEMFDYVYEKALEQTIETLSAVSSAETSAAAELKFKEVREVGPQLFEWLSRRRDGTFFWTEVGLKFIQFENHNYVVAVIRDISRRKETEEIIATERERLSVTLRSIGDGVITTDIKGYVFLVNKVAEELTGWPQSTAKGRKLAEVFTIIDEKSGELSPDPVARVLAAQEGLTLPRHTLLISRDGQRRAIADSAAPIFDRQSRIVGVVLVFRDVTEQQHYEKELLKNRKLESVALLAGGIAHDFNNILTAILGNISLAMTLPGNSEEVYALLAEIEKASLRARDLTQQLLTFSKGGEPVKITAAIENVVRDSASFVLRGTNVRCDFQFAADLEAVLIDSGQISQVVQNLILNACQAMSDGGVIEIEGRNFSQKVSDSAFLAVGKYVEIRISDQGQGIPPELLDKIFDPYFTTKIKGSGLGLAITHSIIKKHGGHIAVAARPGGGTTFTIYLPATDRKEVPLKSKSVLLAHPVSGRIMIMDDEEMIREMVMQMLSRDGYEIIQAADGQEALSLYRQALESGTAIDLVIMDLTIPGGMGGKAAVKELKGLDPQAKVVVSSGYSNDPIMANYADYGFNGAIVKPFRLRDLQEAVARVLSEGSKD